MYLTVLHLTPYDTAKIKILLVLDYFLSAFSLPEFFYPDKCYTWLQICLSLGLSR
ncbi:MAG: hypothetical protein K0R76_1148 [Alphaproteobacteria bacterium]|nr:hypothetical protein [Alphaproteobacteria bacterium]